MDRSQGRRRRSSTTAATTSSRRPTSSRARSSRRAPSDIDSMIAVLYRTNAQSRAIEDALMRDGIPYKIIGGVRFYERKEIKDALAYLKLIINPHDDVSLRRVINVPARGIGKGVMDSLQAISPDAVLADAPPLLAAGLQEVVSARSLWARLLYAIDDAKLGNRAIAPLRGVPRSDRRTVRRRAAGSGVDRHRQDARSHRLSAGSARREQRGSQRADREPHGARLRRARIRDARGRCRHSAASSIDCRCSPRRTRNRASRDAQVWLMTMHAAKGLEFPMVIIAGLEEGLFPHSRSAEDEEEVEEERRLCYVGMTRARRAARAHRRGPAPCVRRVSVVRAVTLPRRDPAATDGSHRAGAEHALRRQLRPLALRVPHQPVRPQGRAPRFKEERSRPTPTRTRTSRRSGCARACGCATRSSASAR